MKSALKTLKKYWSTTKTMYKWKLPLQNQGACAIVYVDSAILHVVI